MRLEFFFTLFKLLFESFRRKETLIYEQVLKSGIGRTVRWPLKGQCLVEVSFSV